ncbi:thiol reductant ABC exporter subunit CydC [Lacticaseibacillus nasuensis]|uniref:thiol reductant ABC exporter subunit CydC n=1 Tax=Lacticaseibacillus nasuensis TaxID=944671 RepID=UPI002245F277|nr:thiol reductant ABC exporter subunit CydC [Lacticaseibacillus nasuensis]MCX2454923.1 thiol reductant ABC exporter subunit CydC [Lacticaseibacillus nasuensis]
MKWRNEQWLRPDLKRYKGLLFWSLVLGMLTFICAGALMFTSGYLIDFSATQPLFAAIYVPVVLTRAFGIGRPVFQYLERLTSHNWVLRITSHMRRKLYRVLESDAAFVSEHHQTGDVLGMLADDIGHIQNLYLRTIFPTVVAGGLTLIATLLLGWFDWGFALWLCVLLLAQIVLVPAWSLVVDKRRKLQQKQLNQTAYVDLTDSVLGLSDWVITHREADFVAQATAAPHALSQSLHASARFEWVRNFVAQLLFGLIPVSLMVWVGQYWTQTAGMANWVGAFVLVIFPLDMAFSGVAQGIGEWPTYKGAVMRLNQLQPTTRTLPKQLPTPQEFQTLTLDHVSFAYSASAPKLIHDTSLTLHRGDKVALLGPSGMGKTTLLQLVLGDLTPTTGQVLVDDTPVLAYQEQRNNLFAVLDQSPFLFNTSVKNNVRLGNEAASDAAVAKAIDAVQLTDLIAQLPQGLDTPVAEAGFDFSGGERQRLALARVLLQDAPIVLLDEPTVGLDPITEAALINTMFTVLADKTVLWVTHHLQGVHRTDRVLFLEAGRLTMDGAPQELAKTDARYRRLYALDAGMKG